MRTIIQKTLYSFCLVIALATAHLSAFQSKSLADDIPTPSRYLSQWLTGNDTLRFEQVAVSTEPLKGFYANRHYQPLWIDGDRLNQRAQSGLAALEASSVHGLDPARYHLETIRTTQRALALNQAKNTQILLSLEVMISDALSAYAADLAGAAASANPRQAKEAALASVAEAKDIGQYLAGLAPQDRGYQAMQGLLAHYRQLNAQGGWAAIPQGKSLKPGMQDARIASLADRLRTSGDLAATIPAPATYEGALVDAVKHFQTRHGLEPDGTVGGKTLQAMNLPVETRIGQIASSMERMRWLPRDLGSRYVLVNIPGYYLKGMSDGKEGVSMRVIVGTAATPTPLFSNVITDIVFNPSWGVPAKIARKELLPKERAKPGYLSRAGYQLVARDGSVMSPSEVDWDDMSAYGLRQKPGSGNALGKVKFTIPNSDSIYLHDTANPTLFSKNERSLSHGCVRLGDPRGLARFMLGLEGWKAAQIDKTYDASQPRTVRIGPVPVHLVYWTSFVDDQGAAHFHSDIYGKDTKLMAEFMPKAADESKLAMAR